MANITAQPVADFSATPTSGCAPLLVKFTDLSSGGATGWKWDLGNGTISALKNPSGTYLASGQYKITLIVKNANGADTLVRDKYITVQVNPTANFSGGPASGCLPLQVQFADKSIAGSGTVSAWKWDFGDGLGSTLQNPQHSYTSSGTFDITLQVKNSFGCGNAVSKINFISTANNVKANFINDVQSNCKPPITIHFQNHSTGPASIKYLWDFGDGGNSTQTDPSHTYTTAGNFTVKLTVLSSGGECVNTFQKNIVIGTVTPDFTSPSAVCPGTLFSLINTSLPSPAAVLWDFGDGATSDSLNVSKVYTLSGTYTIKMVADFGACLDSVSKIITVLPKQLISFTADDTIACKAPFTVNFTGNVPSATAYRWEFGDGFISNVANPSHTYNAAGSFDVILITANGAGCQDTLKKLKFIKIQAPLVTLPSLPQKNCIPFLFTFKATINSPEPVSAYLWNFGDGSTDTAASPTHLFSVIGNYPISLAVNTSTGCTATVRVANGINVGTRPTAKFNASPLAACANVPIVFTDLSTGVVNEWLWDFGDKTSSGAKNPTHLYLDTGYFTVKLIARSSGCPDSVAAVKYIYIKPAVSRFVVKSNCVLPLQKAFADSSRGADTWEWNFGDGSPLITIRNPIHNYADTGTYTVTLKVTNAATGCDNTSPKIVQVIREKARFTASTTTVCRGTGIYLKSQNRPALISSYNWAYGDGSPVQNGRDSIFHTYATAGSFNARLIITDLFGCKDTLLKPAFITVNGPTAKFGSSTGSCLNAGVNFTDSSVTDGLHPIVQWIWNYGDNIIDTLTSPPFVHAYSQTGAYSVKLKLKDSNGCIDSVVKRNVVVISKPTASFAAQDTVTCPITPVQFTSLSEGATLAYLWNFGDGATSSNINPLHQYASANTFTISLKVTDKYGCTDSLQKLNYIAVTLPKANFTLDDSVSACPPFLVSLKNTSVNFSTLLWDFGDGNFSTSLNPTHFYYVPGTYIVQLKATGPGGCTDEKFNTIVVKGPKGVLTYSNTVGCDILKTNFKASAKDNLLFTWDFNDGTTVSTGDSSISHIYTEPGFYLPKLILEDDRGCQVPISGIDTVKVISVKANFGALARMKCDAGDITLIDSSISNDKLNTWQWSFGDGSTSMQQNPVHHYTLAGSYTIGLIVSTANGCKDTVTKNEYIKVIASPDISIQSSGSKCLTDSAIFTGVFLQPEPLAVTWQWDFGNGKTSTLQNPLPQIYPRPGTYMVTAIATNTGPCKDTVKQSILIKPLPVVVAGENIFLCSGTTAQLSVSGASNYQWLSPAGFLSCTACSNPITNTPVNITYRVKGTDAFGCAAFDSVIVQVKNPFALTVTPLIDTLCIGESTRLNASPAENYSWTPAAGLSSSTGRNPLASPTGNIVYKLVAFDSANCFRDSAFVNIIVLKYPVVNAGADITAKAGADVLLSPVYSNDIIAWLWTPATGLNCFNCPAPVAKPGITTTYTIKVNNIAGCSAIDDITIFTTCKSENIFIPNTFSPNGDGTNDVFYPRGTGLNRIRGMKIFNRWGETVFERSNFYANDPSAGWDGSTAGKKFPPDVYTFVMDIICDNNDVIVQQGSITLIR